MIQIVVRNLKKKMSVSKKAKKEINLLKSMPNFPENINIEELEPFLLFLPGNFSETTPDYQSKLLNHFLDAKKILEKLIVENTVCLEKQTELCKEIQSDYFEIPESNVFNFYEILKYKVLTREYHSMKITLEATNLVSMNRMNKNLNDLLVLTDFLLVHPFLVYINLNRAFPGISAITYSYNQKLFIHARLMRCAVREQASVIQHLPNNYFSSTKNKYFVQSIVDQAIQSRKLNLNYFE